MGSGRWSSEDWGKYSTTRSYESKTVGEIYTAKTVKKGLDVKGLTVRESRDSVDNPESTPIILGLDVTGSMGPVLGGIMAKEAGLNKLITNIYDRKPVTDPHVLVAGIGDVECDQHPFQATQFEADIRIAEQLEQLFLERGGGGNSYESYALAWYFAAKHTAIDSFLVRNKKGYLFTIGDELPTPKITNAQILKVFGSAPQAEMLVKDMLTLASRQWNIYHVIVEEGTNFRAHESKRAWTDLLGQRVLVLPDHTKLAEVIVSAIQIAEGADTEDVVKSWDGSTAVAVRAATLGLSKSHPSSGLATL